MKAKFSFVVIDEAANFTEQDAMTALIFTAQHNQGGRLHGVQIGEDKQLPPVYMSEHDVSYFLFNTKSSFRFPAPYLNLTQSLFQRQMVSGRVSRTWLATNY